MRLGKPFSVTSLIVSQALWAEQSYGRLAREDSACGRIWPEVTFEFGAPDTTWRHDVSQTDTRPANSRVERYGRVAVASR
jgi:hypothetical protein